MSAAVWLVRHGEAANSPEPRHLTPNGRAAVARLAQWCAASGVAPDEILHSGLVRAEETAQILAAHLKPAAGVRAVRGLQPGDDADAWPAVLEHEPLSVMLVTHMPFVCDLAEALTGRRGHFAFATAEIAALARDGAAWRVVRTWRP